MKIASLSTLTRVVILAAFYFVGGLLGNASSFMNGEVSLVWPPAGIALAVLLLFGYKFWPGVFCGAVLLTSLQSGKPHGFFTIATAIGNTMGAVICAYLLDRFVRFKPALERVRDVVGFFLLACVLGTTVNAVFNVVGLYYDSPGDVPLERMFPAVINWWVPNALGALVVAPIILAWGSPSSLQWTRARIVEGMLCLFGLYIATKFSFSSWVSYGVDNYPLAFLPYPILIWAALRFGQRGATTGTLLVAALAIYELLQRQGPFVVFGIGTVNDSERISLMLSGSYIGVVAVSSMLLAAAAVEREVAMRATRESEKRYRGVVEDQTDHICRFTPDGSLAFVNDAYCRFHARTREQLIGTSFLPHLDEQDREIPLARFEELTPAHPILAFDDKVRLEPTKIMWQHCTVRALFNERGNIIEYQAVIQDITRRKESEEALRLSEERLRAILGSMVDGVIVVDEKGLISWFNPAAEKVFWRKASEVLDKPIKDLLDGDDRQIYDTYLANHLGTKEIKVIELGALLPSGRSLPIDLAASEVSLGGIRLVIVVVRDISERKQLEEQFHLQFRQLQKMETVGRLAGGIAHDFNNVLQAILGYSNLLDQRLAAEDPNRDTLHQIHKSLAHATWLTRQLLSFSRKQVVQAKVLALNNVVVDMHKLLQRLIGETIQLNMELAEPSPCIRADPGQLEQVILNLALNARDAMPQGGALTIRTSSLNLKQEQISSAGGLVTGTYAALSISDTGCGMSADVKSHLFEPFFTTKDVGKGTGLGLSIVYTVVKQTGGEINVASEVGKGTTFNIYLPRFEGAAPAEEEQQQAAVRTRGTETILLVEDEEVVRLMLIEVLKTEGYNVLDARNGNDAFNLAERHPHPIDLLVTDMTMPGFSGWELARRLGATRPGLPVLFISGYTDHEAARWGKLDQPTEFLQKPFPLDSFLVKARQILDNVKSGAPKPEPKAEPKETVMA
jgi:two-component system, cell cycle sensor histidine kinase and response regulator CckA